MLPLPLGLLLLSSPFAFPQGAEPKLIHLGWDSPTPGTFRSEISGLEAAGTPLQGSAIRFTARAQGLRRPFARGLAGSPAAQNMPGPLVESWLQEGIDDMNAVTPTQVTNNFLLFQSQPGDVDWFDDAGWAYITETARLAGYAAREAGLKGIMFDPEPYTHPYAQFDYLRQPNQADHTFEEYVAQARLRGRQFFSAIQSEFPDVTVLSLFLQSYQLASRYRGPLAFGLDSPSLAYVSGAYALLPAFIDGWLDVAGPLVTIVDGHEESYYNTSDADFERQRFRTREMGRDLVAPQNRARYDAQVQVGMAVYMDAYEASHPLALDLPAGLTYPELYEQNLRLALRTTEEYVWLYGETGAFFTFGSTLGWDDRFPWILPATDAALDPASWPDPDPAVIDAVARERSVSNRLMTWARRRYHNAVLDGTLAANNLARNPSLTSDLADWGLYNDPQLNSTGTYGWEPDGASTPGSVRVVGANAGSVFQTINVVPGDKLWIQAAFKRCGRSEPSINLGWRAPDNSFLSGERSQFFAEEYEPLRPGIPRETDWSTIRGATTVPEGANRLVLTLDVADQLDPLDEASFDDVVVLKVGGAADGPNLVDVPTGPQPIANYSFENGLAGFDVSLTGSVAAVNDPFSGAAAARVGPGIGGLSKEFAILPGQYYALAGWLRRAGETDEAYFGVRFHDASGALIPGSFRNESVKTSTYRQMVVRGQAPPEAATLVLYLWKEDAGSFALLDDLRLEIGDVLGAGAPTPR